MFVMNPQDKLARALEVRNWACVADAYDALVKEGSINRRDWARVGDHFRLACRARDYLTAKRIAVHGINADAITRDSSVRVFTVANHLQKEGLHEDAVELVTAAVKNGILPPLRGSSPRQVFDVMARRAQRGNKPEQAKAFSELGMRTVPFVSGRTLRKSAVPLAVPVKKRTTQKDLG